MAQDRRIWKACRDMRRIPCKGQTGLYRRQDTDPELGEAREEINVDYKNEGFEVGFNATYMIEAAGVMKGDEVVLEMKDHESPAILKSAIQDGYIYVIMPMRI